jgi:hypothetical protein
LIDETGMDLIIEKIKNKHMKRLTIILLILISVSAIAQNIDEEKMNRDLEIAKNVLATMLKGDSERHWGSGSINGSYVQGYGVIFSIPKHYSMIHVRPPKAVVAPRVRIRTSGSDEASIIIEEDIKAYAEEAEKLARKQEELARKQEELAKQQKELSESEKEELAEAMAEIEFNAQEIAEIAKEAEAQALVWHAEYSENMEASMQKTEQAVITFLADYADLIGQLKPTDNILVKQDSPFEEEIFIYGMDDSDDVWVDADVDVDEEDDAGTAGIYSSKKKGSGFSAEVSKKVVTDYKTGKIDFDAFREKVIVKRAAPERKSADLDMFANIFKQYYSPKLSATFFTERTPAYEILDNFGVIFSISTYSSYVDGRYYSMPVLDKEKVSSEERKAAIEELYPKFESDIKSFIVDYGRTIRSLQDDDMLLMKIKMTRCEDCTIPKTIDVSVKMSVLKLFDQQKISREKALASIEIKKNFKSTNF